MAKRKSKGKIYQTRWDGKKVYIPSGYHQIEIEGRNYWQNGHGVIYGMVAYGWKEDRVICLETVNGYRHTRTVELEEVEE